MWKFVVSSLLLFASSARMVNTVPVASDKIVFPKDDDDKTRSSFTMPVTAKPTPSKSDFLKCLDLGDLMPAFNVTTSQFECYPLATRGPCPGETLGGFILEFVSFSTLHSVTERTSLIKE